MKNLKHLYRNSSELIGQKRFIYMANTEVNRENEAPKQKTETAGGDSNVQVAEKKVEGATTVNAAQNSLKLLEDKEKSSEDIVKGKFEKAFSSVREQIKSNMPPADITSMVKPLLEAAFTAEDKKVISDSGILPNPLLEVNGHRYGITLVNGNINLGYDFPINPPN